MDKLNLSDSKLIDSYLQNSLSDVELNQFNERMKDPNFANEFAFRNELVRVSQEKGNEKLYKLLEIESDKLDQQSNFKRFRKYWIVFALLTSLGLFYLFSSILAKPNNEALYATHYEAFPNLIAPIERSDNQSLAGKELALYAYDTQNYNKAYAVFDTLSAMNDELQIYHAIASIEIEKSKIAEELLLDLVNNKQARYTEAAQWYLCLLYLKQNNEEKFLTQAKLIEDDSNHLYYNKIQQLLSEWH